MFGDIGSGIWPITAYRSISILACLESGGGNARTGRRRLLSQLRYAFCFKADFYR